MKTLKLTRLISVLGFLLLFVVAGNASAAVGQENSEKPKTAQQKSGNSTDMNFEDVLVQGKYHFSDEAVTTVEEDKVLDSLLGVRKDFKDRIRKSVSKQ